MAQGARISLAARRLVVIIALVAVAAIWIRLAIRPSSDLLNHREFGRRFVAGSFLYDGGLNYPYLPTWAAAHAPLAAIAPSAVSALVFPFGLAAVVLLVWMLDGLTRTALPLSPSARFWVTAGTVFLTSRFVIRDLLDGGENLMLTALAWAALYVWRQGREWPGACLLGAAIALKLTAGIFLLVLVAWRHHGRLVRSAICAAVLTALPAAGMGATRYLQHVDYWASRVGPGIASADPRIGVLGPEPDGNLALRAGLGRLLIGADVAPWRRMAIAWFLVAALGALIVAAFASIRWRSAAADLDAVLGWATAGVLALLVSPITWRSHAVAIVPACYVLLRCWAAECRLHGLGRLALAAIALPGLVLARGVAGEAVSDWSDRWALTTLALVCLTIGVAAWPTRR